MKACNFASLDPAQRARGIKALGNLSRADRTLWQQFEENSEDIAAETEAAYEQALAGVKPSAIEVVELPEGPTEIAPTVRTRRVQSFFRSTVLTSYDHRCAISGLAVPELLNASHIIPWSVSVERRADPRNGICLNALYDRAFDRGLITFDEDMRVVISERLRVADPWLLHRQALLQIHGAHLHIPSRFQPDSGAMAYHREHLFI